MGNLALMYILKILKWLLFCIYWLLCFYLGLNVCTCKHVSLTVSIHTYLHTYFYILYSIYIVFIFGIVGNGISISLSVHTNWEIDNKVDFEPPTHLNFSGLYRLPLDEWDAPAEHEDGEPLQAVERAIQHEDHAQGRARDLQLIGHLHRNTQVSSKND